MELFDILVSAEEKDNAMRAKHLGISIFRHESALQIGGFPQIFPYHPQIDDSFSRFTVFLWNFFYLLNFFVKSDLALVSCNYFFISEFKTFTTGSCIRL